MRYVWAALIALGIIGLGAVFVWHTMLTVRQHLRDAAAELQAAGQKSFNPDYPIDVGLELPAAEIQRVALANFLMDYWFVWVPIVIAVCFGVAALVGRRSGS